MPILTSITGTSADAIADIARIHFYQNPKVLDVTYGRGVFWRKCRPAKLVRCDTLPLPGVEIVLDATQRLPFPDGTFDVAVVDPPYLRGAYESKRGVHPNLERCYRNNRTSDTHRRLYAPNAWQRMMRVYSAMMQTASMAVKKGGLVVVKGMDDKENWFLRDVLIPTTLRLISIHVLTTTTQPMMRHSYQRHARKNHSYFLVLKRAPTQLPSRRRRRGWSFSG